MFLANTRGAVLRGSSVNDLGDEVDTNVTPVEGYDDLPLGLVERSRRAFDPSSGTWRTVRYFAGRLPGNVVLEDGDRIRDNRTGTLYVVDESVVAPRSISGQSSVTLELRTTGE